MIASFCEFCIRCKVTEVGAPQHYTTLGLNYIFHAFAFACREAAIASVILTS